jgi:hypothetical protein
MTRCGKTGQAQEGDVDVMESSRWNDRRVKQRRRQGAVEGQADMDEPDMGARPRLLWPLRACFGAAQ